MSVLVLLTDDDDGTALIRCPDEETAERIGSAAVFSDGGVSAWKIPAMAIDAQGDVADKIVDLLHDGENCSDLDGNPEVPVQFA